MLTSVYLAVDVPGIQHVDRGLALLLNRGQYLSAPVSFGLLLSLFITAHHIAGSGQAG
jgi:hypothetical protein